MNLDEYINQIDLNQTATSEPVESAAGNTNIYETISMQNESTIK